MAELEQLQHENSGASNELVKEKQKLVEEKSKEVEKLKQQITELEEDNQMNLEAAEESSKLVVEK